jgi:serine/threonine-protein kinase
MAESSTSADSLTPDVGTTIGRRYRVIRRIGEGGMGVVVEAENVVTGKRVAIKWMHPQVAAQPEAAERFLREARASARLRHPNVVDVYDAVHEGDTCFLVMELLEGEPLSFLLERGGMPAHELIALLLDAMRGVVAAHRQGVIHRDIKPDNIFLANESDRASKVPKVLDFGISKLIGAEGLSLTRTGATIGTPMYMSYEQLCGVKDIDVRTDIYAFGVVLYEALTGRPPYQAANLPQLVAKMAHTHPAPPRELRPDIPDGLDRVIQRAMAKDRESRFGSLVELIEQLQPFASAGAFQAQMTAASAVLPVVGRAQPVKPQSSLMVAGRESSPVVTPMETNVPIPAAPRKREALRWLVAAGVFVTVVGVLTAYGSLQPVPEENAAAADGGGKPGEVAGPESPAVQEAVKSGAPAAVPAKPGATAALEAAKQNAGRAKLGVKPGEVRAGAALEGAPAKTVGAPASGAAVRPGAGATGAQDRAAATAAAEQTAKPASATPSSATGALERTVGATDQNAKTGFAAASTASGAPARAAELAGQTGKSGSVTSSIASGTPARGALTLQTGLTGPNATVPANGVPARASATPATLTRRSDAKASASNGVSGPSGEPNVAERPIALPGRPSTPAAVSGSVPRAAAAPGQAPPKADASRSVDANGSASPTTAQPPAAATGASANRPATEPQKPSETKRFRAGRPRTEDF